ncbi:MAG: nucleoside deaminase [Bacteroidetes bacterium]|nr:nucleoside deaminase [Bacteroidota bacterium]MBS1633661.1 nucleoside deaminase [Bacteroidota bacterium]
MRDDIYYMQLCEILGEAASKKGNSPVGAVIIKNGEVIVEAEEAVKSKNDVTCHAEIEAMRLAIQKIKSQDLSDCTLFTTHEPCIMCSYAIRFYKIKKVVFLHRVDYLGGISSSMPLLISENVPPHWGKPPEIIQLKNIKN